MNSFQSEHKSLIFVETKRKADNVTRKLRLEGFKALCIHGDKPQSERNWVLNEFRQGNAMFLLATDVAARGLDVSDIRYVINYDYPNYPEQYVHRIGRTARGDRTGISHSFLSQEDCENIKLIRSLIDILAESKQPVPEELRRIASDPPKRIVERTYRYSRRGAKW